MKAPHVIEPLLAGILALLVGCADQSSSSAQHLPSPEDRLAQEALPSVGDLPGNGWKVTERDNFATASDNRLDEIAAYDPACRHLLSFFTTGGPPPADSGGEPAGRAQIAFERLKPDAPIPSSIEVRIEVDEVPDNPDWALMRTSLEKPESRTCIGRIMATELKQPRLKVDVQVVSASSPTPENRIALAYRISLQAKGEATVEALLEMYLWLHDGAEITALFLGPKSDLTQQTISDSMKAIQGRLRAAGSLRPPLGQGCLR